MKRINHIWKAAGILLGGILLGYLLFGGGGESKKEVHEHLEVSENQIWTCSMHPAVRQSEPGDCPICGMDLIPVAKSGSQVDPDLFVMSENAMKLANVETLIVGSEEASKEIRLNGKVELDERNTYTQSTHIPGRIEQLRVNFTGEKVNQGQVIGSVYSPELVTAQEELLQAAQIKKSQPELFEAAKEKLRNWKISDTQINNMLSRGEPIERFPITADVGGVVTELMAEQGDYLERGMPIYEIANLEELWVLFDVYESNMSWIKEGSIIEYTIESLPGESFTGEIDFIDPLLNNNTRVATARVEIDNQNGRIKPGMFATGMLVNKIYSENEKIVIPESAVLWTGKRSLVYVKEDVESGTGFKLREIVLGASLGDSYVVEEGLSVGEEIVVNGTFTVDAAVQLAGKPSMMNPEENHPTGIVLTVSEKSEIQPVFTSYLNLKDALVADDFELASRQLSALENKMESLDLSAFETKLADDIENYINRLQSSIGDLKAANNISVFRNEFVDLSTVMIDIARSLKPFDQQVYIQHCPMANNEKGANWLSLSEVIRNPYYGSAMLTCGEVAGVIED
ncbi:Cu(I)/Ag(I) efflux system membrane fusion protein [Salegentibacter sp. 24]|uniref:efflux RND transporter periplasmic adaptor subunit n=1 Tax=Salegentibacter sp. 24 TaxID=2183986 RepID=UPI00105E9978|nr:efflux RND transporter periplasmic adaptor subunit [Salegentibacter sp. 24]TDN95351.1 Cu(I)/Ag(I) efflux system membrane fusion protein [Salegentibacter sp. 24]